MTISIEKATPNDAELLHKLQIKAFLPLLEKYQDHQTNPACEPTDKTLERINSSSRGFYKIKKDDHLVGAIVIKHSSPSSIWIGPIFVDPDFQNQKIAQKVMILIENLFPHIKKFELATLSQETGNIHLYQKLGYKLTNRKEKVNDLLDLVFFEKIKH
ncbi:MAG: N-acetyltransferase [Chlamydiae bacterium]|nr:N-acetyltransferase [Chlamydiota bacterium]